MATEYRLFHEELKEWWSTLTWGDLEGAEKELAYQKYLGFDGLIIRSREVGEWS